MRPGLRLTLAGSVGLVVVLAMLAVTYWSMKGSPEPAGTVAAARTADAAQEQPSRRQGETQREAERRAARIAQLRAEIREQEAALEAARAQRSDAAATLEALRSELDEAREQIDDLESRASGDAQR